MCVCVYVCMCVCVYRCLLMFVISLVMLMLWSKLFDMYVTGWKTWDEISRTTGTKPHGNIAAAISQVIIYI